MLQVAVPIGNKVPSKRSSKRPPAGESAFDATRRRSYRLFVAPALIVFALILVLPSVFTVGTSLTKWSGSGPMIFVGIDNYVRMFHNPIFVTALVNTFWIVIGVGVLVYAISFVLTMVLQNAFGRKAIRSIVFFPTLIPGIVISILWGFLFNPDGLVNGFLKLIGVQSPPLWLGSTLIFPTILLGLTWLSVGTYTIILLAATDRIPPEYYEVADLAGASAFQRFWYVTLPLMWDIVSVTAVLWCVSALKTFEFILTFSSSTGTLPNPNIWNLAVFSYAEAFPTSGVASFGAAGACAVVMLALALVLTVLARRFMRREDVEF